MFKNSLIRELSFRGHFVVNVISELIWVGLLLVFINVIFSKTTDVRGWNQYQYLFLMGTHMLVTSIFEAFFFGNCWRVSQLVRTGDLDFVLVQPVNAQFLLSLQRIDYSALTNVPVGLAVCAYALNGQGVILSAGRVGLFFALIAAGVLILYSLLFMFAVTSVWFIRQTGIDHLWFYMVSLARYPADIYRHFAGGTFWFALVFVIPLLMVSNLPANVMVRTFEPLMVVHLFASGLVLLALSTVVLKFALRWYRSASS